MVQVRPRLVQVTKRALEVRTPGARFSGIRRLLVARLDRLGDVVLTLPAVAALRQAYPAARLVLLVRPVAATLAHMVEGVDSVIVAEPGPGALAAALREARADLAVCVSRGAGLAWAAARARVPHRVGAGYRWYSALFERSVAERRRGGDRHEAEYALSFAHRAGAPVTPAIFPLRIPPEADSSVKAWLAAHVTDKRKPIVLHPGSGGSCPPWPVERWIELAGRLSVGGRVVVSIGPADGAVAGAFDAAQAAAREIPRFTGGVPELAALFRRSSLVAANSTGPLHLAAALGAPALGIFPPWPTCGTARWGPYSDRGWALVADTDAVRYWTRSARRRLGDALMRGIDADLVARTIARLA